jgi:FtsZ-binding cell division protein ZapB
MNRTITLEIPEETYEAIEMQAEIKELEPAQIVVEWLAEALKRTQSAAQDPLEALIGTLECEVNEVAEHHDYYVGQALAKELRGG